MYYKIENKKCEVYKKLHEMRKRELEIEKKNEKKLEEKIGLEWDSFLGYFGQQNFRRVTQYSGFKFKHPGKVDMKVWKEDLKNKGCFVPNLRTKLGREMKEFLSNGLEGSFFSQVFKILNIDTPRRFSFPFVEISGEILLLYIDERITIKNKNVIEITSKEFESLRGD